MSEAALIWADLDLSWPSGRPVDVASKAMLGKLAAVSDSDDCAWMRVGDLARKVGACERTIQTRLRRLVKEGLLRETGRTHRLGTRSVPLYELMVDHGAVAAELQRRQDRKLAAAEIRSRMGATVCTHSEPADDAICTPMGATVCTPNEAIRGNTEASASDAGARALEVVAEIMAVWPAGSLLAADVEASRAALLQACDELDDPGQLLLAVRAYLAGLGKISAMLPVSFVAKGGWRLFIERLQASPAQAAVQGWSGPADVFEAVAGKLGADAARAYLGKARFEGGCVIPAGPTAYAKLRAIWPSLGLPYHLTDPRGAS